MKSTFLIIFLTSLIFIKQPSTISNDWEREVFNSFNEINIDGFDVYDFSKCISNQLRFANDPWSTYIGVLGSSNRRIDFHFIATKISNFGYSVKGKRLLDNEILNLTGSIELRNVFQAYDDVFIILFHYKLTEKVETKECFVYEGVGSIVFKIEDDKPKVFWSEDGELRLFNNMFVGYRKGIYTDLIDECIFTFNPSGTYNKLPFRDFFYKDFDEEDLCKCFYEIREEFRQYGWSDYNDNNLYKNDWWR